MGGRWFGLVVACAIAGGGACGRSDLDDAVQGTAGGAPITGAAGGSGGAAGGSGGAAGGSGGAAGVSYGCAAGDSDQTCNDDPSVSALWGTCLPGGGCVCNDGFSYDAATGKCRPGSLCVASGADPWGFTMALDAASCATRPASDCAAVSGARPSVLDYSVLQFLRSACQLPQDTPVRVVLADGCPTLVEMKRSSGMPLDAALTSCLVNVLATKRWICSAATDCSLVEWTLLP